MNNKEKIAILMGFIVILLVSGCEDKNVYNSFCHILGYNKSTDHGTDTDKLFYFRDEAHTIIECDGKIMPYICSNTYECVRANKFGGCLEKGEGLRCMSNFFEKEPKIIWIQASDKQ